MFGVEGSAGSKMHCTTCSTNWVSIDRSESVVLQARSYLILSFGFKYGVENREGITTTGKRSRLTHRGLQRDGISRSEVP